MNLSVVFVFVIIIIVLVVVVVDDNVCVKQHFVTKIVLFFEINIFVCVVVIVVVVIVVVVINITHVVLNRVIIISGISIVIIVVVIDVVVDGVIVSIKSHFPMHPEELQFMEGEVEVRQTVYHLVREVVGAAAVFSVAVVTFCRIFFCLVIIGSIIL